MVEKNIMVKKFSIFISGLLFSVGLFISGMTNPAKVISFLDVTGAWDPSLVWVMMGAIFPTFFLYRFAFKLKKPLYANDFDLPTRQVVDTQLLIGSILFGIGWGLSGICPGPALANVFAGRLDFLMFGAFMLIGMLVANIKLK